MPRFLLMFYDKASRLLTDRRGATAIEYGLIAAGIALAIAGVLLSTGDSLGAYWSKIFNLLGTRMNASS
jgi:pilus assembly protein Flp/PilA